MAMKLKLTPCGAAARYASLRRQSRRPPLLPPSSSSGLGLSGSSLLSASQLAKKWPPPLRPSPEGGGREREREREGEGEKSLLGFFAVQTDLRGRPRPSFVTSSAPSFPSSVRVRPSLTAPCGAEGGSRSRKGCGGAVHDLPKSS